MISNKYYDPVNDEELKWGTDGLLHSPTSDTSFIIYGKKKIIPLISHLDQTLLYPDPDGLLKSKENEIRYQIINGEIVPLLSPIHGKELRLDRDGFYSSKYDNVRYQVSYDGKITPLLDPYQGGSLIPLTDGTFQSKVTGKRFLYDTTRNVMIPLYIPDDSMEDAHLERGYLVGNQTGRGYAINDIGRIMTPEEIRKPLTIDDVKRIMIGAANEILTLQLKDQNVNDIDLPKTSSKVTSQVNMMLGEFLTANEISSEKAMLNYLSNRGMDPRIIELTQKSSTSNFFSMLGQDMKAPISIISKEDSEALYVPTTYNSPTSTVIEILENGNIRLINNHHKPEMVNGIRYGNVIIADISITPNGDLSWVETRHKVEPYDGLQPEGSKKRFVVNSSTHPITITAGGKIKLEIGINMKTVCDTLTDGIIKPIQPSGDSIGELNTIRKMGFDEKYFSQSQIAGINYDEYGNKTVVEYQDLQQIPELSISEESFQELERVA